jgi:hypothetical protein
MFLIRGTGRLIAQRTISVPVSTIATDVIVIGGLIREDANTDRILEWNHGKGCAWKVPDRERTGDLEALGDIRDRGCVRVGRDLRFALLVNGLDRHGGVLMLLHRSLL